MILNKKQNRQPVQQTTPIQPATNPYNNASFNDTDQYFNDFSQFNNNQTGYSTSTQKPQDGFFDMTQQSVLNQTNFANNSTNYYNPNVMVDQSVNYPAQQQQQQQYQPQPAVGATPINQFYNPMQPNMNNIFNDPMAGMALKYSSNLADQGKEYVAKNVDRWFSISKLKYYFAVDTTYVAKKLLILLFPFINRDWTVKYSQAEAVPPKLDVNAPDMYIPVMAFVTYILIVGVCLGTQNKFTPELLGIQASSALGWFLFEIFLIYLSLQILSIKSTLKTFDIIAFCGYKFLGMILCLIASLVLATNGYHIMLIYCCITITYFMVRNLKLMILANNQVDDETSSVQQPGGGVSHSSYETNSLGNKRRIYVLLFISLLQPLLMWWLTRHLVL